MTRAQVAVMAYLGLVLLGAVVLAFLRGRVLGWPGAIGPALLAGLLAFFLAGHLWWRKRGAGR